MSVQHTNCMRRLRKLCSQIPRISRFSIFPCSMCTGCVCTQDDVVLMTLFLRQKVVHA